MKWRWLAGMVGMGFAAGAAAGDVLDDLRIDSRGMVQIFLAPIIGRPGEIRSKALGFEISDNHRSEIAAELGKISPSRAMTFLEERGDFAGALERSGEASLDRVRLLVRLGRLEEARDEMSRVDLTAAGARYEIQMLVRRACGPLEDAEDWARLDDFLEVLGGAAAGATWQAEAWAEKLDVAWHRDRMAELLRDAAADPWRLAVFQDRLGYDAERDRLVAELLANAPAADVVRLGEMLPNSDPALAACIALWKRADLNEDLRRELLRVLLWAPVGNAALEAVRLHVSTMADPRPLVEEILRWSEKDRSVRARESGILEELRRRLPDDLRVASSWVRRDPNPPPAEAVAVFRKLAEQAFVAERDEAFLRGAYQGRAVPGNRNFDPVAEGLRGLAALDRQDLAAKMLGARADWGGLRLRDRLRYLAAAEMDREFVAELLAADFSLPENDVLAGWLANTLRRRLPQLDLPRDVAEQIAGAFAALSAGSAEKKMPAIRADAAGLVRVIQTPQVPVELWKAAFENLRAIVLQRSPDEVPLLDRELFSAVEQQPRLAGLVPAPAAGAETGDRQIDWMASRQAAALLSMFYPPEIRRVAPTADRWAVMDAPYRSRPGEPPLQYLDRWKENSGVRDYLPHPDPDCQRSFRALLENFPPGHPRRIFAEIAVATRRFPCGDAAVEKEAETAMAALLAGGKEARGTELFRYAASQDRGGRPQSGDARGLEVLAEVESLPPAGGRAFLERLGGFARTGMGQSRLADAALKKLNELRQKFAKPAPAPPEGAGLLAAREPTPEAIAAAVRVLDAQVAADYPASGGNFPTQAVAMLRSAGEFGKWRSRAEEMARELGQRPVALLRWLRGIDNGNGTNGESRAAGYDREIFALHPDDRQAARGVAASAARAKDRGLLMSALRAARPEVLQMPAQPEILAVIGNPGAAEVMELLRLQRPDLRLGQSSFPAKLHAWLLLADPAAAADFRAWLALRAAPEEAFLAIARQLADAARKPEAAEFVASRFGIPADYPGHPHRFPPKPPGPEAIRGLKPAIDFLRETDLLAKATELVESQDGANPAVFAALSWIASPDIAGFDRKIPPALAVLPAGERTGALASLQQLCEELPVRDEVLVRILTERLAFPGENEVSLPVQALNAACALRGGEPVVAMAWPRLLGLLDLKKNANNRSYLLTSMRNLFSPMLGGADAATWESYWAWRAADPAKLAGFSQQAFPWRSLPVTADPARLRQVLPRVLEEQGEGAWDLPLAGRWALAAAMSEDAGLLRTVRARLDRDLDTAGKWAELCDLALGDPAAVSPYLLARPAEGGTRFFWTLAAMSPAGEDSPVPEIPAARLSALDGKFEIRLLAGPRADRLVTVRTIPRAAASGDAVVALAPEQKFVAMVAIDPDFGTVRWTTPITAPVAGSSATQMVDGVAKGLTACAGPCGLPAWWVRVRDYKRFELVRRPWFGTRVTLEGWTAGEGKLRLSFEDREGGEISALLVPGPTTPGPIWHWFVLGGAEELKIPAHTARIVVTAGPVNGGATEFAVADLQLRIEPPPELPAGFERLVRAPADSAALSVSPDGKRLAASAKSGRWVIVNLEDGAVSVPRIPIVSEAGDSTSVSAVVWRGLETFAATADGGLYRVDRDSQPLRIASLWEPHAHPLPATLRMSPDGKWFAWQEQGDRLVLVSANGRLRRKFVRPGTFHFELDAAGLRLAGETGAVSRLDTLDFASGKPAEDPAAVLPRPRVRFQGEKSIGNEPLIPAERAATAIDAAGAVYFVEELGNIVRVNPL